MFNQQSSSWEEAWRQCLASVIGPKRASWIGGPPAARMSDVQPEVLLWGEEGGGVMVETEEGEELAGALGSDLLNILCQPGEAPPSVAV